MWEPEHPPAEKIECPLCGRSVDLGEARKCNSCRKVVCIACFDIPLGVCKKCRVEFEDNDESPDYIA